MRACPWCHFTKKQFVLAGLQPVCIDCAMASGIGSVGWLTFLFRVTDPRL